MGCKRPIVCTPLQTGKFLLNDTGKGCLSSARSDEVESPGRKELARDQLLEHDLIAKVASIFSDHTLTSIPSLSSSPCMRGAPHNGLAALISRMRFRISSARNPEFLEDARRSPSQA